MDKGLDIDERLREIIACHAALNSSPLPAATPALRDTRELLSALHWNLKRRGRTPEWSVADAVLHWAMQPDRQVLIRTMPNYPPLLAAVARPPTLLLVRGAEHLLTKAQIAIVGARAASRGGQDMAERLAGELCDAGLCVTSGLARGIDGAAHRGALGADGQTIAVLGHGMDRVYPSNHRRLADEVAANGALVSEFVPGAPPARHHFPQRNRIIAGLSLGTVVVEAAGRSGSLSTAHHALNEGREVFAVPGDVRNPLSVGCHDLIRAGARLTTGLDDILDELPAWGAREWRPRTTDSAPAVNLPVLPDPAAALLEYCGWGPVSAERLAAHSGLPVREVLQALGRLEVSGYMEALPGGVYRRSK